MRLIGLVGPITAIGHMLSHPFMAYAFIAGGAIAVATGLVGHFVVVRGQTFAGDALSHVAFTGALGALAAGIDLRLGLFGSCVVVAVAMAALGRSGRADDVVIGNLFAWLLGLGVLFLALYTSSRSSGTNGNGGVTVLFGSIFGLSAQAATTAAVIAAVVAVVVVAISRPLTFASLDESIASAHGVPVRAIGTLFLVLVGVVAAEATEVVGALMLLGLLATPSAAANRLVVQPLWAMWSSAACTVAAVWIGLTISYAWSTAPPSFSIIAVATAMRLVAGGIGRWHGVRRHFGVRDLRPSA